MHTSKSQCLPIFLSKKIMGKSNSIKKSKTNSLTFHHKKYRTCFIENELQVEKRQKV